VLPDNYQELVLMLVSSILLLYQIILSIIQYIHLLLNFVLEELESDKLQQYCLKLVED